MKKAVIIFPDEWLAYSPSILNLITCLKSDYKVIVLAVDGNSSATAKLEIDHLTLVRTNRFFSRLLAKCRLYRIYQCFRFLMLLTKLKQKEKKIDLFIGVDSVGFLVCRLFSKDAVFYSLEVNRDIFFRAARFIGISYLIIQTPERKNYLIGDDKKPRVFYIQNAPIHSRQYLQKTKNSILGRQKKLIYLGNIIPHHGVECCINALQVLDHNYTLTLKGLICDDYHEKMTLQYRHFFENGRLTVDRSYIGQSELIEYLSDFYLGLCFYDFHFIEENNYNYISCPSGKLFNYYAAALPVIGMDIIGLNSVAKYNTGILIKEITPEKIAEAVYFIEKDYEKFCYRSLVAADVFDYREAFKTFIKNF